MALLPLAFLAWLRWTGRKRDTAWGWIAVAFAVSWLADTAVDAGAPGWAVGFVYPITQAALIGAVLLTRFSAFVFLGALVTAAAWSLAIFGVHQPDILLHSVAFLGVAGIALERWDIPNQLRDSLFVYFGLGWVAWLAHAKFVTVATWYPYQSCRLAGLVLFCGAVRGVQANRDRGVLLAH